MTETDNRIRDRVFGRELAGECIGLAREQFPGASKEMQIAFWEEAARQATAAMTALGIKPKDETPQLPPMSDGDARTFRDTPMPFGKHKGDSMQTILEENPRYLDWICRETEEDNWKVNLRRWLARPDIQEQM